MFGQTFLENTQENEPATNQENSQPLQNHAQRPARLEPVRRSITQKLGFRRIIKNKRQDKLKSKILKVCSPRKSVLLSANKHKSPKKLSNSRAEVLGKGAECIAVEVVDGNSNHLEAVHPKELGGTAENLAPKSGLLPSLSVGVERRVSHLEDELRVCRVGIRRRRVEIVFSQRLEAPWLPAGAGSLAHQPGERL